MRPFTPGKRSGQYAKHPLRGESMIAVQRTVQVQAARTVTLAEQVEALLAAFSVQLPGISLRMGLQGCWLSEILRPSSLIPLPTCSLHIGQLTPAHSPCGLVFLCKALRTRLCPSVEQMRAPLSHRGFSHRCLYQAFTLQYEGLSAATAALPLDRMIKRRYLTCAS